MQMRPGVWLTIHDEANSLPLGLEPRHSLQIFFCDELHVGRDKESI